jgi:hypothetical protein
MKKIFLFLLVVTLTGCSAGIKYQESFLSKDLSFTNIKNSTVTVFGASNIILTEFKKTFADEYSDTTKLNNKIITDFKTEFANQIPSVKIKSGQGKIPEALVGEFSFKDNNTSLINDFFNNLNSDYLIFVNTLDIGNDYNNYTNFNPSTNMSSTYSTEDCKVAADIECWDVKNQKRIFKVKSYGSSTVVLYTFLASLNSAISEAIENGVKYIADNGKK